MVDAENVIYFRSLIQKSQILTLGGFGVPETALKVNILLGYILGAGAF